MAAYQLEFELNWLHGMLKWREEEFTCIQYKEIPNLFHFICNSFSSTTILIMCAAWV